MDPAAVAERPRSVADHVLQSYADDGRRRGQVKSCPDETMPIVEEGYPDMTQGRSAIPRRRGTLPFRSWRRAVFPCKTPRTRRNGARDAAVLERYSAPRLWDERIVCPP